MRLIIACSFFLLIVGCKKNSKSSGDANESLGDPVVSFETILNNYEIIWGMDFTPNGDLLFTEKRGKFYILNQSTGTVNEITGLPSDIDSRGQGGLLDVRVHPNYSSNGWIYLSYASTGGYINIIRGKINNNQFINKETILKSTTNSSWFGHYGCRLAFNHQGYLYIAIGEGSGESQNMNSVWGKIHRVHDDGRVPNDNPIWQGTTAPSSIYAIGLRNPQGLTFNPLTNEIWETEHGPMGGDEINLIKPGVNYGWPIVSYGKNYDGSIITTEPEKPGYELPIHYWTPSIAPSGLTFVSTAKYKNWKGNLLAGSLKFMYLNRIQLQNKKVVAENKLLENVGRVRNIREAPDGTIYIAVEGPGRIIKINVAP